MLFLTGKILSSYAKKKSKTLWSFCDIKLNMWAGWWGRTSNLWVLVSVFSWNKKQVNLINKILINGDVCVAQFIKITLVSALRPRGCSSFNLFLFTCCFTLPFFFHSLHKQKHLCSQPRSLSPSATPAVCVSWSPGGVAGPDVIVGRLWPFHKNKLFHAPKNRSLRHTLAAEHWQKNKSTRQDGDTWEHRASPPWRTRETAASDRSV